MGRFRHHSQFPNDRRRWFYLWPYACFDCRLAFKRPQGDETRPCPQCRGKAFILSRNFRPPARSARDEWEVVRFLHGHGFRYQHIRDERGECVPYPRSLAAAQDFVRKHANQRMAV